VRATADPVAPDALSRLAARVARTALRCPMCVSRRASLLRSLSGPGRTRAVGDPPLRPSGGARLRVLRGIATLPR
jgi:hypothetical protein